MEQNKTKRGKFFGTLEFTLTAIIIILTTIPIIFVGQITIKETTNFLLKNAEKELELANTMISQDIEQTLTHRQELILHSAKELSTAQNQDEKKSILDNAKNFENIANINLYDSSKKLILSEINKSPITIKYEPNARLFDDLIKNGSSFTEFFSLDQNSFAAINIPVLDSNKKVSDVLSGIFNLDFLSKHFPAAAHEQLYPSQNSFVVNQEGRVIAVLRGTIKIGEALTGLAPVANVIAGKEITQEYLFDKQTWIASAIPVKNYNLGIVLQVPKDNVLAVVDSIRLAVLRFTLFIILATVIVALIIAYLIAKPLKKLSRGAARIAEGDYDFKLDAPAVSEEIKTLISSFETMRQKIKDNIEELILAKSKDEAILKSIGDAVLVTDLKKRIIFFNEAAEKASGFSEEEAYNQNADLVIKFVEEKEPNNPIDIIGKVLAHEQSVKMPEGVLLIRKDKIKIAVADSAAPVRDAQNSMIGCITVFRDITKEREAQKIKDEFISIVSHELKTPVTAVNGFLDMFFDGNYGKINKEGVELLNYAREGNSKLLGLVNDLLNVSRIESGKLTYDIKPVYPKEQLNFVMKQLQSIAKEKNLTFKWNEPEAKLPPVLTDPDRVTQVLDNLIGNALKFTQKGSVMINTEVKDKFVKILIKDTGPGIPAEMQGRMFEKFYRAGARVTGGTGLGLYISKQIVEKMGGKIGFESKEGEGSTFYFTLPIAK